MSIAHFEMPESLHERLVWLETKIVGPELLQLVQELEIFASPFAAPTTEDIPNDSLLLQCLGSSLEDVLSTGLGGLSDTQLHELLSRPQLLFELQQKVLSEGSDYWIELANGQHGLSVQPPKLFETEVPDEIVNPPVQTKNEADKSLSYGKFIAALAAGILVVAFGWWAIGRNSTPSGWGFAKIASLESISDPEDYFEALSDAAGEWFKKPTTNKDDLEERLRQFSRGCEELIAAKHAVLDDAQRAWLVEKCNAWKSKIDLLANQLQQNKVSFDDGSEQANEIARRMIDVLKTDFPQSA